MAEKQVSSAQSVNTVCTQNRKISEKEDISFLTFDIDKVCLSEGEQFTLLDSDISTWLDSGNIIILPIQG